MTNQEHKAKQAVLVEKVRRNPYAFKACPCGSVLALDRSECPFCRQYGGWETSPFDVLCAVHLLISRPDNPEVIGYDYRFKP